MIKKHIKPDAFIHQAIMSVNLSSEEEELRQKFLEKHKDQYCMFLFLRRLRLFTARLVEVVRYYCGNTERYFSHRMCVIF